MNNIPSNPAVTKKGTVKIPQKLFTPLKIGKMEIKNRLAMAPMGGYLVFRETPTTTAVTQALAQERDFLIARARGGVGMITMSGGHLTSLDFPLEPSVLERFVVELRKLVKAVHDYDVRIGVQLGHPGRQNEHPIPVQETVAPSPIPWSPHSEIPRELSGKEIEQLIERHVEAAIRVVKEAGFDFVEVKACHGYLLSSFLSPHSNKRNDEYGGDLKRRTRVVLEIMKRIKERLGDELVICCRFNGSDYVEGGLTLEDAKKLAPLFVEAGADFLSVTAGVYGSYPLIVPPMDFKQGCFVHLAEGVKSVVSVPVMAVGRIIDPWLAEDILQAGKADIVAMCRALLADPDLPIKSQRGDFDEIRKCIGCNQGCLDTEAALQQNTCLVNPALGREREMEIVPVREAKKVLVIGGGPGGLAATIAAAERGHKVILYEEKDEVGGQWILASRPTRKQEFMEVVTYLRRQVEKLGVELKLGKKATAITVEEERPDVVIVATGATPLIPSIPGVDRGNVVVAWDVLAGKAKTGKRVLVVGGNGVGLDTADFLASLGRKVVVVEMLDRFGSDLGPSLRWHLRRWLTKQGVEIQASVKVEKIGDDGVLVTKGEQRETWRGFDTVVLAVGASSRNELVDQIKEKVKEIYLIGDAAKPRNGLFAIREGAEVARRI